MANTPPIDFQNAAIDTSNLFIPARVMTGAVEASEIACVHYLQILPAV